MSIMSHLNEQNALTAREHRTLPDAVLTKADMLRLVDPHFDQVITLFEILCDCQAYQDRLDALDVFLIEAKRHQALAEAHNLGELGTRSRKTLIQILERWRADIAPMPNRETFIDAPDPVDHNPADTNLQPEECAA